MEGQMVRSRIKIYSNHACNLLVVIHINHTKNTLLHLILPDSYYGDQQEIIGERQRSRIRTLEAGLGLVSPT